jgi:hypothetical protein
MRKSVPALVAAALVGLAGTAMAVTIAPLTTGGRTLAGPGKTTIAANATETVYTHVSTNTDACATVINSSRAASVRITLVGPAASTVTLDVALGTAGTLCHDGVVRMDLTCLAEATACATQWRIDRN